MRWFPKIPKGMFWAVAVLAISSASALNNGLGRLPAMGWNTWCTLASCYQSNEHDGSFHDVCNEWEVKDVASTMIANGMQAAGYEYVNLDDCWANPTRDANGNIYGDPSRFPSGMKALADWLHANGFKFGLYTSAGWTTCSTGNRNVPSIPGSHGYYQQDADTFASWGVDYVKLDWCGTKDPVTKVPLNQQNATTEFEMALNASGRAMWSNFHCDHGPDNIPSWCPAEGNSWRMDQDHHDNWNNTAEIIEDLKDVAAFAGPFQWNDPDFLMVGGAGCDKNVSGLRCPGQSDIEYATEMSLWSMAAAPLIVATDIRNWTPAMKSTLLNYELIAIDQDPLGIAGGIVANWGCSAGAQYCQIWARPLVSNPKQPNQAVFAVAAYNAANDGPHNITIQWDVIPKANWGASTSVFVRDVWAHEDVGTFVGQYTTTVQSHGTNVFVLTGPSA